MHKRQLYILSVRQGWIVPGLKKWIPNTVTFSKKRKEHKFSYGLCTPPYAAESIANYYRADKQIKRFEDIYQYLCKNELN
jgi:alanine racemase